MNSSARRVSPPAHSILAILTSLSCPRPANLALITTPPSLPAASQNAFRTLCLPSYSLRNPFRAALTWQSSAKVATGAEVFLALLIEHVSGEAGANKTLPVWMRVFMIEIMLLWRCRLFPPYFTEAHGSRTVLVSSIAAATLQQLVSLVNDMVIQEVHHLLLAANSDSSRLSFRMDRPDLSARSTRYFRQSCGPMHVGRWRA